MKTVLSVDGGGIRGVLPAALLRALEEKTHLACAEMFDLIAGTSTGGIIAVGLSHGLLAAQLSDLYTHQGGAIFTKTLFDEIEHLGGGIGPIYSAATLEGILRELLADTRLSDIKGVEILVPAYCTSIPDGHYFKSWKARADSADDFLLRDVARATSAAPIYFPPAKIANVAGASFVMVDGGVFDNNPSDAAAAEAIQLWPGEEIMVVSLGTGTLEKPIDPGSGGLADVGPKLPAIFMDGAAGKTDYLMHRDARVDYQRFNISLATPLADGSTVHDAMDDASAANIAKLEELAAIFVKSVDLDALAARLVP